MSSEEIRELLFQADDLPEGPQQVALLDEAVRLSDSLGDNEAQYFARISLLQGATSAGEHEKAFVAFSWCVAHHDEVDHPLATHDLLWYFKWILGNIAYVPHVDAQQIFALEDEMERWYDKLGYSPRPVHDCRLTNRLAMGRLDELETHYRLWQAATRDDMADCFACELDTEVSYFCERHDDDVALKKAVDVCSGRLGSCKSVPEKTYSRTIRPLLRLGREDEAREYTKAGLPLISKQASFAQYVAEHVLLLLRTGEHSKALRHIQGNLPHAVDAHDKCRLYDVTALVIRDAARHIDGPVTLRIPAEIPIATPDHRYEPEALAGWFESEARNLAEQFDSRNGTNLYTGFLSETRELAQA